MNEELEQLKDRLGWLDTASPNAVMEVVVILMDLCEVLKK